MARTKKTTRKTTRKTTSRSPASVKQRSASRRRKTASPASPLPTSTSSPKLRLNSRFLTFALVILGIALLTYKAGPWLVPAIVNNRPITRFTLWKRMEKSFGSQTLDDVVNEYTLEALIKKKNIQVDESKLKAQMDSLESQFENVGGLDEALTQRGLTRADLEKQVKTQLAVEQILADQVEPSAEDVQADYDANQETLYQDKSFDEVKDEITTRLRDSNLRDAFLKWFAEAKQDIKIKNFGL